MTRRLLPESLGAPHLLHQYLYIYIYAAAMEKRTKLRAWQSGRLSWSTTDSLVRTSLPVRSGARAAVPESKKPPTTKVPCLREKENT